MENDHLKNADGKFLLVILMDFVYSIIYTGFLLVQQDFSFSISLEWILC